jgi:hypothetical protein
MTEETKSELLKITESKITEITKSVDEIRDLLKLTRQVRIYFAGKNTIIDLDNIDRLSEYRLFIGMVILDLASAIRIYLNAKLKYEGIYSARQILVIMNEAFKKIYNFVNKKGIGTTKNREDAFWFRNIGVIIEKDFPNLKNQFDLLTIELEHYSQESWDVIRTKRDLSIHYDKDPTKVYDMLLNLDIEETYKKLSPFLNILIKMFDFTNLIALNYKVKMDSENMKFEMTIDGLIMQLDKFKNGKNDDSISSIQKGLLSLKVRPNFKKPKT